MSKQKSFIKEMIDSGLLKSELEKLGYNLIGKDDKIKTHTVSAHYDYIDVSGGNGIVFMELNEKDYEDFCNMSESEQREMLENEGESEAYGVDIDDYGSLGAIETVTH